MLARRAGCSSGSVASSLPTGSSSSITTEAVDRIQAVQVQRGKSDPPGSTVPVPEAGRRQVLRESKAVLAAVEEVDGPAACSALRSSVDVRTLGAALPRPPAPDGRRAYGAEDGRGSRRRGGLAAFSIDRIYFEREARAQSPRARAKIRPVEVLRDALPRGVRARDRGKLVASTRRAASRRPTRRRAVLEAAAPRSPHARTRRSSPCSSRASRNARSSGP